MCVTELHMRVKELCVKALCVCVGVKELCARVCVCDKVVRVKEFCERNVTKVCVCVCMTKLYGKGLCVK